MEIGGTLQRARRSAGLGLDEVEAATMIPARFVAALERDRFDLLPEGLYRRSFLREYAEFLGLDGDVYADEYTFRQRQAEAVAAARAAAEAAAAEAREHPPRERAARPPAVIALAALGALILVGLVGWLTNGSGQPAARPPAPTTAPVVAASTPAASTHTRAATHAGRRAHTNARATGRAAPQAALTLAALGGDCWLRVRRGSPTGATVYEATLRRGRRVRLGLRAPLWITLGAPWNVQARIGGRSLTAALPAHPAEIVARPTGIRTVARIERAVPPTTEIRATTDQGASDLNTRGYRLMLNGDYAAALPLLEAAARRLSDPGDPVTFYAAFNLGQTLVHLNRCRDALPDLLRAARLEPANAQVTAAVGYARRCDSG